MRNGQVMHKEPSLKTLIDVCERLGGKEERD